MKKASYLLLSFFLLGTAERANLLASPPPVQDWPSLALQLSGESSAVRNAVLGKLRRIPNLEQSLRRELKGEKKALALDVVSALGLRTMLPDLLALSEVDESGFTYSAINSLLNVDNEKSISEVYRERLFRTSTPNAAKVVILDTLGRMGALIPVDRIKKIFQNDSSPEVRSAVLYYARLLLLRHGKLEPLSLLPLALSAEPYSLRVQALYLLSELSPAARNQFAASTLTCAHDPVEAVRVTCKKLFRAQPESR